jgi:hypothetical protein
MVYLKDSKPGKYTSLRDVRYAINIAPPDDFWRWSQLRAAIEHSLDDHGYTYEVDMMKFMNYDHYMNRMNVSMETNLPYVGGAFGVFIEAQNNELVNLGSIYAMIDTAILRLSGPPTAKEAQSHIEKWIERMGCCDDCGGLVEHHYVRLDPHHPHPNEEGDHWTIFCLHPLSEDGILTDRAVELRDARTARLEAGLPFLEEETR